MFIIEETVLGPEFMHHNQIALQKTLKFAILGLSTRFINHSNRSMEVSQKKQCEHPKSEKPNSNTKPDVDLEQLILNELSEHEEIQDTWNFARSINQDHQAVVGAMKSLLPDAYVTDDLITTIYFALTDEGKDILTRGSPEVQVFNAVASMGSITVAEIQRRLGEVSKIGMGPCLKNKWLKKEGDNLIPLVNEVIDEIADQLRLIDETGREPGEEEGKNLKRRKLLQQVTRKSYRVTRGPAYQSTRVKRVAELTREMLLVDSEVYL
jgi:phenylalanyl-tRNA synthetase alpha chain